jgi:hypothetical protein
MGVDIETEVVVGRTRAEVAAYMFDPAHDAEWTNGVVECRPLTPGRHRAGSRVERVTRFLGRQFTYVYEVVDADADQFVEIRVDEPFPMRIRYELEDAGEGTRARIRAQGEASGFFRLASPLLSRLVRRSIGRDLRALKANLEAG